MQLVSNANKLRLLSRDINSSSNVWLYLEKWVWHKMKQRRLEVGSKESCQRHSQHHTCSFFNHDQVLPILGNLNSKGRSASKGLSSLWLCLMGAAEASLCRKDPNLNMLNKFIDRESPFMSLWNSRDSTRNGSDTRLYWFTACPLKSSLSRHSPAARESVFTQPCELSGRVPGSN